MRKLRNILLGAVSFYTVIILLLYFFQEKILFQPEELGADYTFQFEHSFNELFLETKDGVCLNAIHFTNPNPKGVILYFHGNRGSLRRWGEITSFFAKKEYDVIVMDYRSYGKSEGTIKEKHLYEDGQLFYDFASKYYPEEKITIYGRSIGTGIAVKIASQNKPKNLVLETPYYNIKDIVESWLPHIPTNLLLRYKIPSNQFAKNISCSVTIYHGTDDGVVPYKSGKRLFDAIPVSSKKLITIEDGSHNDLVDFYKYQETIDKVLAN